MRPLACLRAITLRVGFHNSMLLSIVPWPSSSLIPCSLPCPTHRRLFLPAPLCLRRTRLLPIPSMVRDSFQLMPGARSFVMPPVALILTSLLHPVLSRMLLPPVSTQAMTMLFLLPLFLLASHPLLLLMYRHCTSFSHLLFAVSESTHGSRLLTFLTDR